MPTPPPPAVMLSTDEIRLNDFVESHLVIIYAISWFFCCFLLLFFLILIVDFREDIVMLPIKVHVYSVQIRDIGRFLAKLNPWTNTFGHRLVRMHCSRIHSSVKLSTPKVYTCILIVAISCKICVSNY